MTAGVMLMSLANEPYRSEVVLASRLVEELETSNASIDTLQDMGVDNIYVGQTCDFSGPGLDVEQLLESADVELLHRNDQAVVLGVAN